jgi:hypothetical protein
MSAKTKRMGTINQLLQMHGQGLKNKANWQGFPHCPDPRVYAGYTDVMLWLNYSVKHDAQSPAS